MNRNRKTVAKDNPSTSVKQTNRDNTNLLSVSHSNDVYRPMPIRSQNFHTSPNNPMQLNGSERRNSLNSNTFNFSNMSKIVIDVAP